MAQTSNDGRSMWALRLTEQEKKDLRDLAKLDTTTMSNAFRISLRREVKRRLNR